MAQTFRYGWIALALAISLLVGWSFGAWEAKDYVRSVVIGFGVTSVLLTAVLAVLYEVRYGRTASSETGAKWAARMIRPLEVWGMGWSFILLLGIQLPEIARSIGQPLEWGLLMATGVSIALALFWLDRMIARQLRVLAATVGS